MKQFQVYDLYECYGEVGQFDTLSEAEKAAERWKEETDGECDVIIRKWDETLYAYRGIEIPLEVKEAFQSIASDILDAVHKLEDETSPGFVQWLISQGYLSRDDVDIETLRDIYEAMDDDDKCERGDAYD